MEYETDEDGYSYTNTGGDVSGGEIMILLNEYVRFALNERCCECKKNYLFNKNVLNVLFVSMNFVFLFYICESRKT